jgi:diguanylate cyclase (GGDEF)-like protein
MPGAKAGRADPTRRGLPRPERMVFVVVAALVIVVATLVASGLQAVQMIDDTTAANERQVVAHLFEDEPALEIAPLRAMHVATLAGLTSPRLASASTATGGETAFSLDSGDRALIWTPRHTASRVFMRIAPYRLAIVLALVPVLVVVLLRFRAFTADLERQRHEARALAGRDSLTGLPNRLEFDRQLEAELAEGGELTLMYLDLNGFKQVNDVFGHTVGDLVLVAVGERLRTYLPAACVAARLGGDEFAIIVRASEAEMTEIASDLAILLAEPHGVGERTASVPASIGIARSPEHGTTPDALLRNADIALYEAKARQHRPFVLYQETIAATRMAFPETPRSATPAAG